MVIRARTRASLKIGLCAACPVPVQTERAPAGDDAKTQADGVNGCRVADEKIKDIGRKANNGD